MDDEELARRWVAETLGASSVREIRSLTFGTISDVRLLEADGEPVVLRRYKAPWLLDGAPALVEGEVRALREAVAVLGALAPEPIAADPSGERAGSPALLMTFLAGSAVIHRMDLDQGAATLTRLHATVPPPTLGPAHEWLDHAAVEVPAWSQSPRAWSALIDLVRDTKPTSQSAFLHRDYHPGNLLWDDGELTGVVDWAFACHGPPSIDVAHMRTNLALVDGPARANEFLDVYSGLNPPYRHHPWWDAADLLSFDDDFSGVLAFNAFGTKLTVAQLRSRADAHADEIARNID